MKILFEEDTVSCSCFVFFRCFWSFCAFIDWTAEEWKGNREEREGMKCNKGVQCEIELAAATARTQPLYMGRPLNQPSHESTPLKLKIIISSFARKDKSHS